METQFDPVTGEPIVNNTMDIPKKKSPVGLILAILIPVIAIIVGGFFYLKAQGAFLSTPDKILLAIENTANDRSSIAKALDFSDFTKDGSFSTMINVSMSGTGYGMEYGINIDKKEKQVYATLDLGKTDIDASVGLMDDRLKLYVPDLVDRVFVYDYNSSIDGDLGDELDDHNDTLELVNEFLKAMYDYDFSAENKSKDLEKDIKNIRGWSKTLDYKKASKKTFEVNGKDVKCDGYTTTIEPDNWEELIDIICETSFVTQTLEKLDELDDVDVDFNEEFDRAVESMKEAVNELDDIEVTLYIYKNKIAYVSFTFEIDGEEHELAVYFKGGSYRTENIEVTADDETILEVKGETKGNESSSKIKVNDNVVCEYSYNSKDGDFEIEIDNVGTLALELKKSKSEFTVEFKDFDSETDEIPASVEKMLKMLEFKVTVTKDAQFKDMDGKEMLINECDKSDFEDLAEEIQENIEKLRDLSKSLSDIDL